MNTTQEEQTIKSVLVDKTFLTGLLFDELELRSKFLISELIENQTQLMTTEMVIYEVLSDMIERQKDFLFPKYIADKALVLLEELDIWIVKALPVINEVYQLRSPKSSDPEVGRKPYVNISLEALTLICIAKQRNLELWTADSSLKKTLQIFEEYAKWSHKKLIGF